MLRDPGPGGTMSIDERARHELHARLDELLGPEPAGTLMSYLPPVGWADVATKRDLDALADSLEHRFEATLYRELGTLRSEIATSLDGIRSDMAAQTRVYVFSMAGLVLTVAGIALAAARMG